MSMDYYSDEVFSVPGSEVVAKAVADGMTWALLNYLQQWCLSNSFSAKGVSVLVKVYHTLGCHTNHWFLSEKYLLGGSAGEAKIPGSVAALGLDIGTRINQFATRFEQPRADSLWGERDLILKSLRADPQSFAAWLHLITEYAELGELLEAVWILFVVRMNVPASAATAAAFREQLDLIKICGTSGGFWAFVAEDAFLSSVSEILAGDKPREEIADSVGNLFASFLALSLNRNDLLRPFAWPN